jgi:ribosomal protein L14E/L6E/L27E
MEEGSNLQTGYLVVSTKGRDAGVVYLIASRPCEDYMRLVNGDHRKLINAKLKKQKHVRALDIKLNKIEEKFKNNVKIFDSEIYSAIKKALSGEQV